MSSNLWDHEDPIVDLGLDVPAWIEQDISPSDVAAIVQGGCASGAYMPAVTYHTARETMNEHGDDVLQYIQDAFGEIPPLEMTDMSWAGLAVHFLSYAVEIWAGRMEDEVSDTLEDAA